MLSQQSFTVVEQLLQTANNLKIKKFVILTSEVTLCIVEFKNIFFNSNILVLLRKLLIPLLHESLLTIV